MNDLGDFELTKWGGDNMVLVTYPNLSKKSLEELKGVVTTMISIGQIS